jgi:hypothetical protein
MGVFSINRSGRGFRTLAICRAKKSIDFIWDIMDSAWYQAMLSTLYVINSVNKFVSYRASG